MMMNLVLLAVWNWVQMIIFASRSAQENYWQESTLCCVENGKSEFLSCKDITVDVQKAVVRKGNTELFLSALEYRLLLVFLQNPGVVFSRKKLLEMIWDVTGEFINDNTLTVYIKRLRDKIETNPQEPEILFTVRGLGYKAGE